MFVDAIKNFVTSRTEALSDPLQESVAPFLLATSDFRLYELLKNDSQFFRITEENSQPTAFFNNIRWRNFNGGG